MTDLKSIRPLVASLTVMVYAMLFALSPAGFRFALVTAILFALTLYSSVISRLFWTGSPMFGPSRRVPAIGMALFFPLIFMVFGDAFLPVQQLEFPTIVAIVIAIFVAGFDTRGYGIQVNGGKKKVTVHSLDVSGSIGSDRLL